MKENEEIFNSVNEAIPVVWWLTYLLGGRVVIPTDPLFWIKNFPPKDTASLTLKKEADGTMVLIANQIEEVVFND